MNLILIRSPFKTSQFQPGSHLVAWNKSSPSPCSPQGKSQCCHSTCKTHFKTTYSYFYRSVIVDQGVPFSIPICITRHPMIEVNIWYIIWMMRPHGLHDLLCATHYRLYHVVNLIQNIVYDLISFSSSLKWYPFSLGCSHCPSEWGLKHQRHPRFICAFPLVSWDPVRFHSVIPFLFSGMNSRYWATLRTSRENTCPYRLVTFSTQSKTAQIRMGLLYRGTKCFK